uniref:Uncharacterized protein n=1 Tax=Rhizophora mucronata TaxID=61149 RepID=A0A2P2P381_RHIMU
MALYLLDLDDLKWLIIETYGYNGGTRWMRNLVNRYSDILCCT